MRKVVDSNQLQSEVLRSYLSKSQTNFAILTDYAAMEAYKGKTLSSIFRSMEIVGEFPDQVIILKNTRTICGLSSRGPGIQKRLINERQTREFKRFTRLLESANKGDTLLRQELLERGKLATKNIDQLLGNPKATAAAFDEIAKTFTKEERRIIRSRQPYSSEMIDKVVRNTLIIAGNLFNDHPSVQTLPKFEELQNTFIFRNSLCMFLLALDWAAYGGVADVSKQTLRNDMIDINFATYGTFFDGLITADAKVLRIYRRACLLLTRIFNG